MKNPTKIAVPKIFTKGMKRIPRLKGGQAMAPSPEATGDDVPRITNDTVAAHREEVLASARKYIYPLQASRHRIVKVSAGLFLAVVILFFAYCGLSLYKLQSTSSFFYSVSRVIPFPVAKAGPSYVAYENYLFELRHYIHYYQTQQQVDPASSSVRQQIVSYKQQALQQVIDAAFIKQLAAQHHLSVSNSEVSNEIALVKSQNRLGSSDQILGDVLKQFWGWSIDDFRRELKSQLLTQKVASALDTATHDRANTALAQLSDGADFAKLAAQYSDDVSTKTSGGQYGFAIAQTNRDVSPQIVDALFRLRPGQTSGVINTGYTLEIVKLLKVDGDKAQAAHISFNLQNINIYLAPLKAQQKTHRYIHV